MLAPGGALRGDGVGSDGGSGELGGGSCGVGGIVSGGNDGGDTLVVGVICLLNMNGTQSIVTCFRLSLCVLSS